MGGLKRGGLSLKRIILLAVALTGTGLTTDAYTYGSYDEEVAKDVMVYAGASYCPVTKVQEWRMETDCAARTSGMQISEVFDLADLSTGTSYDKAFAYTGVDTERKWVVAAFKGSNETDDFIYDMQGGEFTFKDCKIGGHNFGKVHDGFCGYYKSLHQAGIQTSLMALAAANPTYKVIITGHSLGAAAAALAAVDYYHLSGAHAMLYTYGQPRVGDYDFAKTVNKHTEEAYRIVHASDIVAHLPICCGAFSCWTSSACPYHTEEMVWYNNDMTSNKYQECDGGEDQSCNNWLDMSVSDHLSYFNLEIANYCCF